MEDNEIQQRLSAEFDPSEVKHKPAVVSGKRALALAYIDARTVQDRLDEVLGVAGWQDDYEVRESGSVICRLSLKMGDGVWITKTDVGSLSSQDDDGDKLKAAFSDALKRAAVKFGVGRYLYRLPADWRDYDPVKKTLGAPDDGKPAQRTPQKTAQKASSPQNAQNGPSEASVASGRTLLASAAPEGLEALQRAWESLPAQIREKLLVEKEAAKKVAISAMAPPAHKKVGG